jgi:signal peptidase I
VTNKPRKWWIAGLLSLICPGVGHIYIGEARKALIIFALPLIFYAALILCLNVTFKVLFLPFFLFGLLAYYAIVVTDAVKKAIKFKNQYFLKTYNKILVYLGVIVLIGVAVTSLRTYIRENQVEAFTISSRSMEPTLLLGDHLFVDRRQTARNPNRGDIIVFEYPKDPDKYFAKRVVAVGGETVMIRDKEVFVNNKQVKETYAIYKETFVFPATSNPRDNFGPLTVPDGSYFVLGDNRDRSLDSRFFGCIQKSKIKGTVGGIYWSWDRKNHAVRWDRIGIKVR